MKDNFHPQTQLAVITCLCGNTSNILSTKNVLSTETCSHCHPFYTGLKRPVTQNSRIARFLGKYKKNNLPL